MTSLKTTTNQNTRNLVIPLGSLFIKLDAYKSMIYGRLSLYNEQKHVQNPINLRPPLLSNPPQP